MARLIQVLDEHLLVTLTGLTRVGALAGEIRIPYSCIRAVQVGPATMAAGARKVAGVNALFADIREGHFRKGGEWYFLSFESGARVLSLELTGFYWLGRLYAGVVLEVEQPEQVAAAIRSKLG